MIRSRTAAGAEALTGTATAPARHVPRSAPTSAGRFPIRTTTGSCGHRFRAGVSSSRHGLAKRCKLGAVEGLRRAGDTTAPLPERALKQAGERRSHHDAALAKRASRQARAARRPSRRAISMNSILSIDPSPSMMRSMFERGVERLRHARSLVGEVDRPLGLPHQARVDHGDVPRQRQSPRLEFGGRHDAVDHADLMRPGGVDAILAPVRMISLATLGPTIQGSIMTTMPAPNFNSGRRRRRPRSRW